MVPTVDEAKISVAHESVAAGALTTTAAPVPASRITLAAGDALWSMVTEPERAPGADGVKVMLSAQVAPGATLTPEEQVLLVMLNSAPLLVVAPSNKATVPVFVNVTVCAAVVAPTAIEAKLRDVLDNDADGDPTTTVTPMPDSETVLVAGVAL